VYDSFHRRVIPASPEVVWEAITTQRGLRGWWWTDTTLEANARVGSVGQFRTSGLLIEFRIDVLEKPTRVKWTNISSFAPEWRCTVLEFQLEPDGEDCILRFTHWGIKNDETEFYATTNTNWGIYMLSLERYLASGQGMPF
jgi:uncharacterized protein YndB with AHSA1/START domain